MSFKVDIHSHILPEIIPDFHNEFGYGDFIHLDHHKPNYANMIKGKSFFREIYCNCWDPKVRVSESDEKGVDVQVLSTVPVMFSYWAKPKDGARVARYINEDIAKTVNGQPNRFVGLGTLPLQDQELSLEELDYCIKDLGLSGIEIGTHVNNLNLSDPELFPIFKRAEELNAAIFVHPWDMMGFDKMEKYWLPWLVGMPAETSLAICSMIFGGVFEKLPNLRVAFAHGGGSFPITIGRIEHGFNVRPDLVAVDNPVNPREYIGRFWLDSILHDQNALKFVADLVGTEKICLGTDYPFPLGEAEPGELIEASSFDFNSKERMLGLNALEWLNLSRSQFD